MTALPLLAHIRLLRGVLVRSAIYSVLGGIIIFLLFDKIIELFLLLFQSDTTTKTVAMHSIFEGFNVRLKVAALGGFIIASPAWGTEILRFIFPGLTRQEKQFISFSLVGALLLAIAGVYSGYRFILPTSIRVLTSVSFVPDSVSIWLNYNDSIVYAIRFLGYSLLLFQFPILLLALMRLGLISRQGVKKTSRYSIIGIFIAAAIVTPPDIISQLGLAVPLIGLYGLTLLIAYILKLG